jgi:hypothetical protein
MDKRAGLVSGMVEMTVKVYQYIIQKAKATNPNANLGEVYKFVATELGDTHMGEQFDYLFLLSALNVYGEIAKNGLKNLSDLQELIGEIEKNADSVEKDSPSKEKVKEKPKEEEKKEDGDGRGVQIYMVTLRDKSTEEQN